MATQERRRSLAFGALSKYAGLIAIAIGGLVLCGWAFNIEGLKSVFPGLATMKANTALCFILAGLALNLKQAEKPNSIKLSYVSQSCAFIVLALALLTLGEYAFTQDLFIDQLIFGDPQTPQAFSPGRMSNTTAINFALLGIALLVLNFETRYKIRPAQFLALLAGAIASIALIGYLYGVESLYTVEIYSSMALHTGLGFAALSLGILFARPDQGFMEIVTTESIGGLILRRLIPAAIAIPVVLGWFRLQGQLAGLYDTNFGVALTALSSAASLIVLIWINAAWLNRVDTDRKKTEVVLGQSEERFRNTLDAMLEGGQVIDFDWRYLYVNDAVVRQGRETKENLLGRTMMEVYPGIENTELFTVLKRCMQERAPQHVENEFSYPDGRKGWFELSIQPVEDGIFILSMDITNRKQAEEKIAYQAYLLENINDAVIGTDENSMLTFWNHAAERMFGWTAEEVLGHSGREILRSEILNTDRQSVFKIPAENERWKGEALQYRKDGSQVINELSSITLHDANGQITGYVSVSRDISERKHAEEELQKAYDGLGLQVQERTAALSGANALLQTMMDNIPDHIYFKDVEGRFISNSKSQAQMMGMSESAEVVGKTDFDFFPRDHAQRSYDEEQELMRSDQPLLNLEERVVWPDGRVTWVSTTKLPLRDPQANVIGTFGISRDITARKQAEEDLQKSNIQLVATNKELEAFSYSVSHDLRAPLRTIDGFSQAVLEDYGNTLPVDGREYLTRVRKAAQHMAALIDDMLNLSRVTRATFESAPINLSQLAEDIITDLQHADPDRKVAVTIAANLTANGDPNLLRVALENLLNNSWKFTSKQQQGEIEFGSKCENDEIIYFVRDNGAGFDMAYAEKLFGAFQRLHAMTEFPGTGVGLATVQRIIHRHGGRIWAESAVGNGATFYFTLGPRTRMEN